MGRLSCSDLAGVATVADALIERAQAAQRHAYSPYSEFPVGAALEADDGRVFVGVNVENASYGLTICAERVAVGSAVAAGARRFRRLVIATSAEHPTPPCGACRQVLAQFGLEVRIEAVTPTTSRQWRLAELLPDPFGVE